jgi:hypothetical protein
MMKSKKLAKALGFLAATGVMSAMSSAEADVPHYKRFDGHYELVRQEQGYEKIWNWECPAPKVISQEGNVTTVDATGACKTTTAKTTNLNCSPELYVKGGQMAEIYSDGAFYKMDDFVFYDKSPLDHVISDAPANGLDHYGNVSKIKDENLETDTCEMENDSFIQCLFEKTVMDYVKISNKSEPLLVSNDWSNNEKKIEKHSLEKKGDLLILTESADGAMTNGQGKWVKDSETRLKCDYRLVQ